MSFALLPCNACLHINSGKRKAEAPIISYFFLKSVQVFPEPFVIDRESGLVPDEEFQDLDHGRCSLGVVALDLIGVGVLEQLRPVLRIDDSMTACRLVAQGLGLTVSPYYPPELRDASLCLRPLDWLFPADYLVVWSGTCRPGRASHLAARQASKGTLPCAEVWS